MGTNDSDFSSQVGAFVRGALKGDALVTFKRALARSAKLRERVAEAAAEELTVHLVEEPSLNRAPRRLLPSTPQASRLTLGPLLGRGGMAQVYAATQPQLGREVAVKMALPGATEKVREKLLQEARVTGALEHPSIVPIHDVIEDADGQLQVVLKRIEGQSWVSLIDAPDEVRRRFEKDPLEWHVSVAIALCRAVQFAHERGIVHRDIKPHNVMIGRFGEVMLLDWGVAATLAPDPSGLLPFVGDVPFAGTLAYMAPEQLAALTEDFGPWTDVFLLAGSLAHAVFGRAPYAQLSLRQRALEPFAAPVVGERPEVPQALRALLVHALRPTAAERVRSADEFRRALEQFLDRSSARRLADAGARLAVEARAAWARGDRAAGEAAAAEADHRLRAALEIDPSWTELQGLVDALAADRVRSAVKDGEASAASFLLAGVPRPPATLVSEVDEAVQAEQRERERLKALERDLDRGVGLSGRQWMLSIFGGWWVAFWLVVAAAFPPSLWLLQSFLSLYTLSATAGALTIWRGLLRHGLTRQMLFVQGAMMLVSLALVSVAPGLKLTIEATLVGLMLVWALGMGCLAIIIEAASVVPAVAWLGAAVVASVWPAGLPLMLGVGALVHGVVPMVVSFRVKERAAQ
ncbi:MAG: serine/threonine-protein kinase [Myxococcaceae bacterium]|nr:serine/threonine-protein kinase [Myxococcaceae bacterium]